MSTISITAARTPDKPAIIFGNGETIEFCREAIAHYKCPRSVDFTDELPRLPTGKLLKRQLRERNWSDQGARV